jgi:hypothetical protein
MKNRNKHKKYRRPKPQSDTHALAMAKWRNDTFNPNKLTPEQENLLHRMKTRRENLTNKNL